MSKAETENSAGEPTPDRAAKPDTVQGGSVDAAPAPAAEPTPQPDSALLQAQLDQARREAAENRDGWLRAKAEVENVRKRAQEDVVKAGKFAIDKFALAMLPVKDSLEATLVAESATLESLKEGVELTLKQLAAGLAGSAITEVNPIGERFDPHRHEAIGTIDSDGEGNRVVSVLQKGYLLNDRVLRPALVMVSKATQRPGQA
jgi:molecular chaperone GrpE